MGDTMTVIRKGYVALITRTKQRPKPKVMTRDRFLVKAIGDSHGVRLGVVSFKKHMKGKRVRFKLEVIEDDR